MNNKNRQDAYRVRPSYSFARMVQLQKHRPQRAAGIRWERAGNVWTEAFHAWQLEFSRLANLENQRDETGCLCWHRVTQPVMLFYFHSGYSAKGAIDEVVAIFRKPAFKGVEMIAAMQARLKWSYVR